MKPRINTNQKSKVVECLLCYRDINIGVNPNISKFITCKNCEMVFEIINLDPIMIDWPYYDDDYDEIDELYE